MRLDVAVSILAHTLPLVAESSLMSSVNHGRKKERSLLQHPSHAPRARAHHESKPASRNAERNVLKQSKASKQASKITQVSRKDATECNPRSNNPDVGIFSCAADTHCIQDDESTLGGFCVAFQEAERQAAMHRSLQDGGLCYDPDCDCSDFENGIGTYVCASSECVDDEGTICGRKEDIVVNKADGSYRTSTCFVDTDGSPIQSYCYSTQFDGVRKSGCELEYNGVMCKSCSHVICADEFGGGEGLEFDCSNASSESSAKGTSCDGGDWKDFFLNPSALTPESTPAPVEPPAPESPMMDSNPPPTTVEPPAPDSPNMDSNPPPATVDSTLPYKEPAPEPTSDAGSIFRRGPMVVSAVAAVVLMAASVGVA